MVSIAATLRAFRPHWEECDAGVAADFSPDASVEPVTFVLRSFRSLIDGDVATIRTAGKTMIMGEVKYG